MIATSTQLPDHTSPPLLYDLFPAHEWHPDQSPSAAPAASVAVRLLPTPPPPADRPLTGPGVPSWQLVLSPESNLVAVLTDTHLEIHAFVDAADLRESPLNPSLTAGRPVPSTAQTRVALWPLPLPDLGNDEEATRDHRIWRRIAWAEPLYGESGDLEKDSNWLAVADWDGSVHILELTNPCVDLVHVATIHPDDTPAPSSKQSTSGTTSDIDPLVFLSLSLDSVDPTVHKLLTVSFAGNVRLAALTTLATDLRTLSACITTANHAVESTYVRYRPLGTFSTAPWLHFTTSATYVHITRTLYVTGKADCPPHIAAAVFKDYQSDDTSTELLLDAETEPVPVIALAVASGGIMLHSNIEPPVPKRAEPETGLLVSLASAAMSIFGFGRARGSSRSAESDPVAASLEMELTGVQLSAWTSTKSTSSPDSAIVLLLLRDAGGNLLVLSPDLTARERYDGGFLTLAHQGHPLSHAAWWDGAIATAAGPGKSPQRVPAIITCSEGGLLFVHSYPQFTPLSAAEHFAAPVALAQAVNGRCCILDCETTSPTGALVAPAPPAPSTSRSAKLAAAATTPRGLLARSLRSITNTLLWHFDDDPNTHTAQLRAVMAQDHAGHAGAARRHVTMYDWQPLTPNEMLMRHLVDKEYAAALELAKAHGLTTDVVYQAQWRAVVAGEGGEGKADEKIADVLANVKDVMWVLQACVDACPRDARTAREVIVHGLRLTEEAKAWATSVSAAAASAASSSSDDDEVDADDADGDHTKTNAPDDHTFALLEYRLTLLRLLDRLELYTRIHGSSTSSTSLGSDPNYHFLRDANLVDVACAYARLGDTRALGVLLSTHPPLAVFRPTVAKCFPAYLDPAGYSKLVLPDKANCSRAAAREPAKHWRQPDWCESAAVAARVGWVDDVVSAALALGVEPVDTDEDVGALTKWYLERAREMEAASGCVDMAVRLLDLACVRGVPGLGGLHARLKQLQMFAYDVLPHVAELSLEWQRIGLDEFEHMPPEQVLRQVFGVTYDEVERKGAAAAAATVGKAGAGAAAAVSGLVGKAVGGSVGSILKRGGSGESPTGPGGLQVTHAASKLSLDQMVQRFLVPYVVQSGAHLALLDILSGMFLGRPELVIRILAYDDLWWNRVHPDPAVGDLEHDPKQEVVFAERVLEMAYSVETADAKWLDILGRLFEVIPDLSGDDDDDAEEGDEEAEQGEDEESGSDEEARSDDEALWPVPPVGKSDTVGCGANEPMDPHRVIVWRRVQVYEAVITAAEVLSHVHLFVSPTVLRNAGKHSSTSNSTSPVMQTATGPSSSGDLLSSTLMRIGAAASGASTMGNSPQRQPWTRDQYSILHELVRRTPMVPIELDWLLDAIIDLVALKFWRIPLQDVYGPVAQHALTAGSNKHFGMAAKFIPPEQLADVVMQLVNQRADARKFDDALKILNVAAIPSLVPKLSLFKALHRLHDLGVPGVSRTMSNDELIARTVECPGISRDAVLELGASLGFSTIKTMAMIIKILPQDKAIELSLDLLASLATQADAGDHRLACETVLGIARQCPEHSRIPSLLQAAFETVPAQYIKSVLDLCSQIEPMVVSPVGSPHDIKPAREKLLDRKLVPPIITKLYPAEPSYADMIEWLTRDEHIHDSTAPVEPAFNSATSIHSAIVAAPFCDPSLVDASLHDLLVFAGTNRSAVKSLGEHEAPILDKLATLSTTSTAVEDFARLSLSAHADQKLISAATELQAIERQSIVRMLANFPDIDLVKFTSAPEYQSQTLVHLLEYSPLANYGSAVDTAALLVDHAQLPQQTLVHAWLKANAGYAGSASLLGHRPGAWDRWVASVKNGGDQGAAVLATIKSLLAQPTTTPQAQNVLYETAAQLVPDAARSMHARQALIDLFSRLHVLDWPVQDLVAQCSSGNRGYFYSLFQSFVSSEQSYDTLLRDVVPKLGAITPIPQIDELPSTGTPTKALVARDLESILAAVWLPRAISLPTSPRPAAPNPCLTSSTPSPVSSPAKHDDSRFGRLFATIASTATTFRPGSPSLATAQGSTEKTVFDSAAVLVSRIMPAEWPAVSKPVKSLMRQQFSTRSLAGIDKLVSAIHGIVPEDPAVKAVKEATQAAREWAESRLSYPFMDRLLSDAGVGTAAVQQLIVDGHPIARIRDIAVRAASCQLAFASSLGSNQAAIVKYDAFAFDRDLRDTFKTLVIAQYDLSPVLRSVHGSNKEANMLLQVATEHGGAGAAQVVETLIAQLSPSTPVLAFKMHAIRSIGGTLKDLSRDLDPLHEQWLRSCSTDEEHGARLRALVGWMEAGTVDLTSLWVREYQFGQTLAIEYIVHVRLQTPALASETELEVIQNMSSQVHILAFALTSTNPDVLAYGKSLLPPPTFDAAGHPVQQAWPSPILDALVPVLQLRKSLADVAQRFGIALPPQPISQATTNLSSARIAEPQDSGLSPAHSLPDITGMHPVMWAAALVGRVPLPDFKSMLGGTGSAAGVADPRCGSQVRAQRAGVIQLDDVDDRQRRKWVKSKYDQEIL